MKKRSSYQLKKHWIKKIIRHKKIAIFFVTISAIFFLILVILPVPSNTNGFKSISELQTYAASLDENIEAESENWLYPSFESYYQNKFSSTFTKKISKKLSYMFFKMPPFSETYFKSLLVENTQERHESGWHDNFIQKINIDNDSKLIIFGAIQGAFHSMVRYLEQLQKLDIINEHLQLKDKNTFIVFLGNVINRSPFTLETLTIVLKLLKENPSKVIYLRGTNEFPDYWRRHTLRRELELRTRDLSNSQIPLEEEIDNFFNTLPITLYCILNDSNKNTGSLSYFKISPFIQNEKLKQSLAEVHIKQFLKSKSTDPITFFNIPKNEAVPHSISNDGNVELRAVITDILKREHYEETDGLRLLSPMDGVIAWTVLSCPTMVYKRAMNFYYDAFVIISPNKLTKKWQISLFHRDVRKPSKTFVSKSYDFFTGEKIDQSA